MNARLQVEHGVTELVTDLDLVAEQLWIAAGSPLSEAVLAAGAGALAPTRHSIEVRLAAEDPSRAFAPAPGRVGLWQMPSGPGVRVDAAIRSGERVPPDYDPLIAKIMTVGPDRRSAIDRMRRALDEVSVTGIQTTLPFDRALFRDPAFAAGEINTDWVEERWDGEAHRAASMVVAADVAAALATRTAAAPSLHKDAASSWRLAGRAAALDRWPRGGSR